MAYAFGDSDPAALRLERLADVFEPSTRSLLGRAADRLPGGRARRAVDLGCAHGRTTRLVADCLGCDLVTGIDESERFLERAERRADARLAFRRADVTRAPLPGAPAEALFCRFLLSHLPDPIAALDTWAGALAPGGLLLVEEVEWIRPGLGAFARYLEIVEDMLAARGHTLDIGPALAAASPAGLTLVDSRVHELTVDVRDAATLFSLNMQAWKHGADGRRRDETLARELTELASHPPDPARVRPLWGLRQLIWQRQAARPGPD